VDCAVFGWETTITNRFRCRVSRVTGIKRGPNNSHASARFPCAAQSPSPIPGRAKSVVADSLETVLRKIEYWHQGSIAKFKIKCGVGKSRRFFALGKTNEIRVSNKLLGHAVRLRSESNSRRSALKKKLLYGFTRQRSAMPRTVIKDLFDMVLLHSYKVPRASIIFANAGKYVHSSKLRPCGMCAKLIRSNSRCCCCEQTR
jgi:hypothetical protein